MDPPDPTNQNQPEAETSVIGTARGDELGFPPATTTDLVPTTSSCHSPCVKLPKLSMKRFNGDLTKPFGTLLNHMNIPTQPWSCIDKFV